MQFAYRAKQDLRTEASGTIDAADLTAAVQELRRMGLYPLEVSPLESARGPQAKLLAGRSLSRSSLALWARTVGQGLAAGLSLTQALHLVAEQEKGRPVGEVARFLEQKVTAGLSLAGAMEQLSGAFSPVAVRLVEAGEAGGALEEVLRALAEQVETESDLLAKVQGALWYPAFVLTGGIVTVAVLLWVVVPKLGLLFTETGQPLPWLTQFMISSGKMVVWLILAVGAGIGLLIWLARRRGFAAPWREALGEGVSRLPGLGPLMRQAEVARMSALLGLLVGHGLPLPASLRLVAGTLARKRLRSQVGYSQQQVVEGVALSESFRRAGIREPFLLTMVAMGEAQGDLALAFRQAAARYHQEVDRRVKAVSALIEPVLILLVGLVVGAIVVSMLLPIFQINFAVD